MSWAAVAASVAGVTAGSLLSDDGGNQITGSSPSVGTFASMSPEQQEALRQILGRLSGPGRAVTPGQAFKPYGGRLTAPTSKLQNLSLSALEQMTMNEATGGTGSTRYYQNELDKIIKSGGSPVDINDFFTKQVQEPLLKSFSDEVIPRLQSTFSGSAAFGTDKRKQQELMTGNLMKTLAGSRSEMAYKSQNDALTRLMTALGLGANIKEGTVGNLTSTLAAGGVPQQTEQAGLTADYNEFLRGQNAGQGDIQQLMAALGMSSFTPVVNPGSQGILGGVANAATTAMINNMTRGNRNNTGGWLDNTNYTNGYWEG